MPRRSRKKSVRQADKPVDGVSSQATHNEELKKKPKPKTKLRKKLEKTKPKQVSASSNKQDTTINTPLNYSIYQIC